MAFNDRYNTDDVLLRAVLVGLIDLLNKKIVIEYVIDDDDSQMKPVPFYPAMANDERFMQDFYMHYHPDCDTSYAEGNYDAIPRGAVEFANLSIDSASLVNKFVRGTYHKKEDGQIKAYSDYINVVPLRVTYNIEIKAGSLLEAFKITQEFIATFYKAATYQINYKGFRVPVQVGFAQDYMIERPLQFSYGDDKKIIISFPLELEVYQPVVGDPSSQTENTEMFRGNTMRRGIGNILYEVSGVSGNFAKFEGSVDSGLSAVNPPDPSERYKEPPPIEP